MRVAPRIVLSKQEQRTLEKWASDAQHVGAHARESAHCADGRPKAMPNKGPLPHSSGWTRTRSGVGEVVSPLRGQRALGRNARGARTTGARTPTRRRSCVAKSSRRRHRRRRTTPRIGSCRSMARHLGTTHSFVNRVWRAHGLKPHLIRTFKLSNDPRFEEKLRDVVGLYLDPPQNAAVFSFDEKRSDPGVGPHPTPACQ